VTEAPPVDYAHVPTGEPRPASINVIAGIGIVLGVLFVLCKPAGLIIQLLVTLPQPNPVMDLMRNDPTMRAFSIFSAGTGTLLSLLLLMSSLGSLALKPWARAGMFGYAALAILMTAVEQVMGIYVVGPEVERVMRQSGMPQPPGIAWMSGWIGIVIVLLFKLWYPALIFYYYTRPNVKLAFERGLPGKGI
jgi:hypothetical protein